jgi:hypothetical protein
MTNFIIGEACNANETYIIILSMLGLLYILITGHDERRHKAA